MTRQIGIITFALVSSLVSLPIAAVDWTVGWEGNDSWSHGFLTIRHPVVVSGNQQVIAWGTASYLSYDVVDGPRRTSVRAPGVGAGATWRWQSGGTSFGIGPGFEVRWISRGTQEGSETQAGFLVQGDVHHRFTDRLVGLGSGSYYDSIEWFASRASVEQELTPGFRVGPEVAYQGNDDITVTELGGVARTSVGDRTWLVARGGTATTRFRDGSERSDPYFSVGLAYSF